MKTVIKTTLGLCEGIEEKDYIRWFGIPYAAPPVGSLRFKRATEHEGWEGIKLFDRMGPKPIQMTGGKFAKLMQSDNRESEDCLHLNVWAPRSSHVPAADGFAKESKQDAGKPVFVWIYGGGHHGGEASVPEYDLKSFAQNDVVAVSFNYRLGVLGFYNFSNINSEFDSNCGISDMILALKWVHDNIANFGGDPSQVTLCGESAGASAIMALLACPVAKNYFSRAIMMSGIMSNVSGMRMQKINNERFLKTVGITPEEITALKTMKVEELKKGCATFFADPEEWAPGIMANGPVIDDLIVKNPLEALSSGEASGKKLMFGTCRNEGSLFYMMEICPMKWEEVEKMLRLNGYEDRIPKFCKVYHEGSERHRVVAVNRDRMFWADTMKCALAQSKYNDTYVYRFDFNTAISYLTRLNPTHTMDVCPALNTRGGNMFRLYKGLPEKKWERLVQEMHGAFLNFVKMGNPSTSVLGEWPRFDGKQKAAMVFSRNTKLSADVFDEKRYELWEEIALYQGN